jgi:hypothetical protein
MFEEGPKNDQVSRIFANHWEKDAERDFGTGWKHNAQPTAVELQEWVKEYPKRQHFEATNSDSAVRRYFVGFSDQNQQQAAKGIDFQLEVDLPVKLFGQDGYKPSEEAIKIANAAIQARWKRIKPDAPPVALDHSFVKYSGYRAAQDPNVPVEGFKPYQSPKGELAWIDRAPQALCVLPPDHA